MIERALFNKGKQIVWNMIKNKREELAQPKANLDPSYFERKEYVPMQWDKYDYWPKTWPWSLSTQSESIHIPELEVEVAEEEEQIVLEPSKLTHPIFRHKWDSHSRKGWAKAAGLKKYQATEDENIKLEEYLYKNKIKDVDDNWAFLYDDWSISTPWWTILNKAVSKANPEPVANTSNPEPKKEVNINNAKAELIQSKILALRWKLSDEEIIAKYWKWKYWWAVTRILKNTK